MKRQKKIIAKHGDTIIEVTLSVAVFSLIAVLALNLMNNGISNAQRTLEITMARNEIDAQSEALRYIHSSYVAERQLSRDKSQFRKLWDALRKAALSNVNDPNGIAYDINSISSCSEAYGGANNSARMGSPLYNMNSFIINTRMIMPDTSATFAGESYDDVIKDIIIGIGDFRLTDATGAQVNNPFYPPAVYPRIIYKEDTSLGASRGIGNNTAGGTKTNNNGSLIEDRIYNRISRVEGIWIVAAGEAGRGTLSSFYDFYIRTCWHGAGDKVPSTITTIVRLYNPEVIE